MPIVKIEKSDDGSLYVFGKATGPDLDLDQQIIDADFARKGMAPWFASWGNIRQMHATSLPPAGKAVELEEREDGQYIKAKIVEPGAVRLCQEGVYQAFSVGIANAKVIRDTTAKGGRIIDGTFVETSLVDYPANPTCTFTLAKRANAAGELAADGEIMVVREAWTAKRDYSDDERASMADSGEAMPDGSFPIKTKADLQNAISSYGRAKDAAAAKKHIIQRAKDLGLTDELPADWPGSTKEDDSSKAGQPAARKAGAHDPIRGSHSHAHSAYGSQGGDATHTHEHDHAGDAGHNHSHTPDAEAGDGDGSAGEADVGKRSRPAYAIKRLHDAHCPAYAWDAVKAAYPAIAKDGVALTVGPQALAAVYEMLVAEVNEDGGTGSGIWDIYNVWAIYYELHSYIESEQFAEVYGDDCFFAARSALHEAWKAAQTAPGESAAPLLIPHPGPRPSDEVQAQRFNRPNLTAGHETPAGGEMPPRIPDATHVPEASDFDREAITAGHEADSPANKLLRTHDLVAKLYPDICPMKPPEATKMDAAMSASPPAADPLNTRPEAVPVPKELTEAPRRAPGEKATEPDVTKAALLDQEAISQMVADAISKAVEPLEKKIADQQGLIDQLGGQPDEEKAPLRTPLGSQRVEKVSHVAEAQKRAAEQAQKQADEEGNMLIAAYRRMAASSDPDAREAAERMLTKIAGASTTKPEEALTG